MRQRLRWQRLLWNSCQQGLALQEVHSMQQQVAALLLLLVVLLGAMCHHIR
jgi:hypothetical protein